MVSSARSILHFEVTEEVIRLPGDEEARLAAEAVQRGDADSRQIRINDSLARIAGNGSKILRDAKAAQKGKLHD